MVRDREGSEEPIEERGGTRRKESLETAFLGSGKGGERGRGRSAGGEMMTFGIEEIRVASMEEFEEEIKDGTG
jgi:hypothetical protein